MIWPAGHPTWLLAPSWPWASKDRQAGVGGWLCGATGGLDCVPSPCASALQCLDSTALYGLHSHLPSPSHCLSMAALGQAAMQWVWWARWWAFPQRLCLLLLEWPARRLQCSDPLALRRLSNPRVLVKRLAGCGCCPTLSAPTCSPPPVLAILLFPPEG